MRSPGQPPPSLLVNDSPVLHSDWLGCCRCGKDQFWLPRLVFQRTRTLKPRIQLGIFAGIHGDEPASVLGLLDFARQLVLTPDIGKEYQIWIYPICNPAGLADGTRHSRSGKDLNREFWIDSPEPEIRLMEEEIRRRNFDGVISLHTDDTSDGLYGFVRGATLTRHLLVPALAAAEQALPRNQRSLIDGFHAVEGVIHSGYGGILSAPPNTHPEPFEIVLETPQHAPMELQRRAFVLALGEILPEYLRLISFAADI